MKIATICLSLIAVLAAGSGWAQPAKRAPGPAAPTPAAVNAANPTAQAVVMDMPGAAYMLGRDDVVDVTLLGRTDFGGRSRIQADGSIQLPLIGKVQAAEHTTSEVSETIRKALQSGGYFADPVVVVEVSAYSARYVTVLGAVGAPGLVPMNKPYRLSEILAKVGGVRETAADYLAVRSEGGEERDYKIKELATGDTTQDPYVKAGDKIYSPLAQTFYIYGQVRSPGEYPLVTDMSVRMAIAKSGGLTESGSEKGVSVTRGGKKVKLDTGAKLLPGDVVVVAERLF